MDYIPNTANLRLVAGMLMGMLCEFGRRCSPYGRYKMELGISLPPRWHPRPLEDVLACDSWFVSHFSLVCWALGPNSHNHCIRNSYFFSISYILHESPALQVPPDLFSYITTKTSRRILKPGSTPEGPGFDMSRPGGDLCAWCTEPYEEDSWEWASLHLKTI